MKRVLAKNPEAISESESTRTPSSGPFPTIQLIRKRALAKLLDCNPWSIDRYRKAGKFPQPVWLSDTTPAWRIVDIEAWIAERQQHSPSKPKNSANTSPASARQFSRRG
jgi:predicted DNA-binding transcriptional regulator AlpA